MMLKKGIFTLMFIFMAVGTASCGNTNPGQENRVSGEPTVSGQAVSEQSVSGQAAEGAVMTKEITTNAAGPKIRDRIDITAEPAIDAQKQIDVIASQKNTWNMGNPTDKISPEAYYISNFNYALIDLDQDGYVEILVYSRQGTGQYTHFSVYEINESGNGVVKWSIQRDSFAEEEDVSPDFYEYPVEAYFDRSTGCYHYSVWDHMHASALDGADYLVDMAVVNNTIQMHVVTHASFGPDGEYESEDDPNSYYQGMTKRYMFYRTYDIESEELEKANKEAVEDLTWDLEHSWYAFAIEDITRDTAFEASLSDDIRQQLETLTKCKTGLEQYIDYEDLFVEYAVTDFDRDGKPELTAAHIGGTGRYCSYSMHEVDESGKNVVRWKRDTPEGESLADICNANEVTTYTDESSGVIYYLFEDFLHITGKEHYTIPKTVFVKKNVVHDTGELDNDKRKKMKKGKQALGWRHGYGCDLSRMKNSGFMYDELVASWKVFCGE